MDKKIIAVIPAHNEEKTILEVISKTKKYVNEVLVIDDCSSDRTGDIAGKHATLLRNNIRMGKGYSLRKGFDYAIKKRYDTVVTLDADYEHNPDEIPVLLKGREKLDIIIGKRTGHRSFSRFLLHLWTVFWLSKVLGVSDPYSGFRAIKSDALKRMHLKSDGFEIELEMLLEAKRLCLKIGEIGISHRYSKRTHVRITDYIRINNLFDEWVISNISFLNLGPFRSFLLISAGRLGLLIGRVSESCLKVLR